MKDAIYSGADGITYAEVEHSVEGGPHHHIGKILHACFPAPFIDLVNEYNDLVDNCIITLLDEVEEKIYSYDMRLRSTGGRIFNIRLNSDRIEFFTKYPTANGFVDECPF